MSELKYAASFRELIVYQKARQLSREIFQFTARFPKEEMFSLTDQVRRSSRSVGAQIAEAWGKRKYEKHFASKLTDADGEQYETQHWIETARDCDYLTPQETESLLQRYAEIGRLLGGMIAKSDQFCNPSPYHVRELQADYIVSTSDD
ncbi:MAG: S23 ribosomal protein [Anaerolineaceae bacterium]|nr:MAG: S23 ribosomal protein [Anaerolineaceae bacterium]